MNLFEQLDQTWEMFAISIRCHANFNSDIGA